MHTTSATPSPGFTLERRSDRVEDTLLLNDTRELLAALPKGVRPALLPRDFPRIANEVVARWPNTASLLGYIDGLLEDKRGNRRGFPPLVAEELRALRSQIMLRRDAPAADETTAD